MTTVADYKRKIAGLLNKAEATDNEHERETFSAAAERLMIKMGIDLADLEDRGQVKREEVVEVRRQWTTIYAPAMSTFTYAVAQGFGNITVLQSRWGKDAVNNYVIGHKSDVETFNALMDSLHLQVMSALKVFRRENREFRRAFTIHENFVTDRSFVEAFGRAVGQRLHATRREEVEEATPGAALVLASRQERVDDWVGEQYPKLRKSRSRGQQWSQHGASAGHGAGQRASLGGKGIGGGHKAVSS